jgi:hypothetical protein
MPRRKIYDTEKIALHLRLAAGFTERLFLSMVCEISCLQRTRLALEKTRDSPFGMRKNAQKSPS